MKNDNYKEVSSIASRHLGKVGGEGYKDRYDPSLLVPIPRRLNRDAYKIDEKALPFVGLDVWNAYEVSALTSKGLPVSGMLKILCNASSKFHVESKSIKLYLNSFNMSVMGDTADQVKKNIELKVIKDLSELLGDKVLVKMYCNGEGEEEGLDDFTPIGQLVDLDSIEFTSYRSDADILKFKERSNKVIATRITSDLLRSNCRVTNQPDWGDVYIYMETKGIPDYSSIAQYIVSHRKVNHFHEEIAEMAYMHLLEAYHPSRLMVACMYTRRGGLDINPIRANDSSLIPSAFNNKLVRLRKTLRQ